MMADGDEALLRTVDLRKRFGSIEAVQDVSLSVRRGRVYGFLGPNGAGKSTTIGMILGLIAPTGGHVEAFGLDTRRHLSHVLKRTGAILEGQGYYPLLSARDNLRIWGAISGRDDIRRIDEVLEQVGLAGRARDRAGTYSQGMKQRLLLAGALLHDPELIVLDEPTNGLDPAGIREFRELIRELAGRGKTVFLSSHLLAEVEQTCDDVGIVHRGRLIAEGPVATLVHRARTVELEVTDPETAAEVLASLDWTGAVQRDGARFVVEAPPERAADLSRALAEHGVYLSELRAGRSTLEEYFLEVTGGSPADA